MKRFFGVKVPSNQTVSKKLEYPLHLTQVAIDTKAKSAEKTSLEIEVDGEKHTLGSCRNGVVDQFQLDLIFDPESEIKFTSVGPNALHVLGSFVVIDSYELDDEDEFERELNSGDEELEGDDDESEGEDLEEQTKSMDDKPHVHFDESANQMSPTSSTTKLQRKDTPKKLPTSQDEKTNKTTPTQEKKNSNGNKKEEATTSKKRKNAEITESPKEVPKDALELKHAQDAKQNSAKKAKLDEKKTPPKKQETPQKSPSTASPIGSPRTALGGLVIEDLVMGNGASIADGRKIGVKYVGRLTNGKEFDSSLNRPFVFRYGIGEVIKGWDFGLKGMRVGGKRKLTIPPKLGYGSERAGKIPPNSTLVFEVELTKVF